METKNEATELDAIIAASEPTTGTAATSATATVAGPTIVITSLAPAPEPKPSIGTIVHFRAPCVDGDHTIRAAIVTRVWSPACVNLTVFAEDGSTYGVTSASLGSSWVWPERA